MPLEEVPCSSPRPNSQRASLFIGELCVGRRSIPRSNFASVRGGQPKTDLFRRYRSAARGAISVARAFRRRSRLPVECHKPRQSPAPGFGEKYWSLSGFPSHSLESGGGAFLTVIFGQILAYSAFSDSHFSSPGSLSACRFLCGGVRLALARKRKEPREKLLVLFLGHFIDKPHRALNDVAIRCLAARGFQLSDVGGEVDLGLRVLERAELRLGAGGLARVGRGFCFEGGLPSPPDGRRRVVAQALRDRQRGAPCIDVGSVGEDVEQLGADGLVDIVEAIAGKPLAEHLVVACALRLVGLGVGHSVGASDFKRLADCEPIIVGRILLDALPRLLTAADIRVAVTASGTSEGLRLRGSLIRSRSRIRVCTPRAHLALEVVLAWGSLFHAIQVDRVNR